MTISVDGDGAVFQVTGKSIDFPGYLRAYVEGSDDPQAELADQETVLPAVRQGQSVNCQDLSEKDHTTQPPARFTEASLTQALEERGIGRPSTYASIIETILSREYVFKKGSALVPSWIAFSVAKLMSEHLPRLVDFEFTAQMEDDLDAISRGEADNVAYLNEFYYGNGAPGLKKQLDHKIEEIDARAVSRFPVGAGPNGQEICVRVGRYGPYLEYGERRASVPDDLPPDELTQAKAEELLSKAEKGDEPLGVCPETGRQVYVKVGRFGPYVQLAPGAEDEPARNASLLKGMDISEVTLDVALRLLSLPRTLGAHPDTSEDVVAFNGKFGPYIKCGQETRSLPPDLSPVDVTLEQALALLAQPKTRRGRGAAKEPLKVFETRSPVTQQAVQVLDGRYGPYVTDGQTNASLPRGTDVATFSFEAALQLLAERSAKGPPRKKKTARPAKAAAASRKTNTQPRKKAAATPRKTTSKKTAVKGRS
jgi:DNA topoisomerase-1